MPGTIYVSSGGAKAFAYIGVTYPAGSTLTCTKGAMTLKAKNTSSQWVFAVPSAGDWIIEAVGGSLTATQTVTISEGDKGILKMVTLIFSGHYYNRGTFNAEYAALLTPSTARATENETRFTMVSPANSTFEMYLRFGKVDLTYINKLLFVYSGSVSSGDIDGCIFISQVEITSYVNAAAITTRTDNPSVTEATIELDVSALSGDYYIYVGTNSRGGSWKNARTINILEVGYA